jgi:hypothetical protein
MHAVMQQERRLTSILALFPNWYNVPQPFVTCYLSDVAPKKQLPSFCKATDSPLRASTKKV